MTELSLETSQKLIAETCDELKTFLLAKNVAYGNSAIAPLGIFAKELAPLDQIRVRIDDKLNRVKFGGEFAGDDTEWDLAGYFVLLRVARKLEALGSEAERSRT